MTMITVEKDSGPAVSSPRRPRRRFRLILLIVLAVTGGWFGFGQPWFRKHQLTSACASADRILIAYRTPPERIGPDEWSRGERLVHEIRGRDKVEGLLRAIQLRPSVPLLECLCSAPPYIQISDGEKVLALLTIHHEAGLRWNGGRWRGDSRLSAVSQKALPAWIEREGGPALAEMRSNLDRLWTQYTAEQEREWRIEEHPGSRPSETRAAR